MPWRRLYSGEIGRAYQEDILMKWLKKLPADAKTVRSWVCEALILSCLSFPEIVPLGRFNALPRYTFGAHTCIQLIANFVYFRGSMLSMASNRRTPSTHSSTLPLLKHQSHSKNFRPKVISKFSNVRTIARNTRCYPRNLWHQSTPITCIVHKNTHTINVRSHFENCWGVRIHRRDSRTIEYKSFSGSCQRSIFPQRHLSTTKSYKSTCQKSYKSTYQILQQSYSNNVSLQQLVWKIATRARVCQHFHGRP
jgi:hypothetical protein